MASSNDAAQLPPAAERQASFEQAVAYSLHLWPALTLAVQNGWGGPDSADKRDWFAGAIADLFPEFSDAAPSQQAPSAGEPDEQDVETVLLQVMMDEFEVNTDDDSALEVAGNIVRARAQCAVGQFDEVRRLAERFSNLKGSKVDCLFKKADDADQETDWESDDDDVDEDDEDDNVDDVGAGGADVGMDDAPGSASAQREKGQPEVDEDGFTKVTHKRR
ncbi:uncharacterized protein UV8b_06144 [Ustilaginoidea virens]|uniref:Pre-rRNA-processing protein TSR2 n=1 Tax=Ustilaginoidea virens TaxID=1159556 RepID=A0A8E5MIT5_USTVR|nr:uncharacterized protein UV8b_06144 [Ustilaginoidea virens]QUC21903.1 hypothetical protein UV8b_06144 [Ustilaginoidea virens]